MFQFIKVQKVISKTIIDLKWIRVFLFFSGHKIRPKYDKSKQDNIKNIFFRSLDKTKTSPTG